MPHRDPEFRVSFAGFLVTLLLAAGPLPAQQEDEAVADAAGVPEVIDEIVVYGDVSLPRLKEQIYRAEENLFDVFNQLNSSDEFDVECEFMRRAGTRRRIHRCMPGFAVDVEREAIYEVKSGSEISRFARSGAPTFFESYARKPLLRERDEALWQEMAEIVRGNAELQKAVIELVRANRIYESERARRCDGQGLFCK